jgi:hypothetical protein
VPETTNIATMAEILSNNLFSVFGWLTTGTTNHNWPCENPELHKRKTHPSDVVFYYDEPYSLTRTYVNCDLKSYKAGSITAGAIESAMASLSRALTCAEISASWRDMYVDKDVTASIVGLLFIYNHDGAYDKDFDCVMTTLRLDDVNIPTGSRIIVLGPRMIHWLNNVRYDIVQMRGENLLPDSQACRFHFPELVRRKNVQPSARAATLEMLTGPWITLQYTDPSTKQVGYVIYYRHRGESSKEFLYILDYLEHYQMLSATTTIQLRLLDPAPNAPSHFQHAIREYVDAYEGGEAMAELLRKIKYSAITNVVSTFSEVEVGMFHE